MGPGHDSRNGGRRRSQEPERGAASLAPDAAIIIHLKMVPLPAPARLLLLPPPGKAAELPGLLPDAAPLSASRKRQRLTHLSPEEKAMRRYRPGGSVGRPEGGRGACVGQRSLCSWPASLPAEWRSRGQVPANAWLVLQSDLLLGILDSLDPEMFLQYCGSERMCIQQLEEVISGEEPDSLPASPSPSLGSPSAKLEAINELIRFDHVYTKPLVSEIPSEMSTQADNLPVKTEKASLPPSDQQLCETPVLTKEEPVDLFLPELGVCHLLSPHESSETACLLEAWSDSGYEGSPSPFSDMASPLGTERSWEETFANELFPQLISV
uniref:Uncharacterized protein n=1 Tax=Sphenodon punctatus TaxID=8508 RepID=A0A8D0GQ44_SPHPU